MYIPKRPKGSLANRRKFQKNFSYRKAEKNVARLISSKYETYKNQLKKVGF